MRENFPAHPGLARIDRSDHALAAHLLGDFADHFGARDGGGVDRHLVCPRQQQRARVFDCAHPAADGQRHKADFRRAPDHVEQRPAPFVAGGDIEEAQLVRACRVIGLRLLHRVARIAQIDEIDALDHPPIADIKAGNDADADGHQSSTMLPPT